MTVCGEKVTGVCVAGKCPYFKRCHPIVWDKYGKIKPKTNEEWLRTLNTEQLAEFLWNYTHDVINDWDHVNDPMFRHMPLKNILGDNCTKKDSWVEWLKQPHTAR